MRFEASEVSHVLPLRDHAFANVLQRRSFDDLFAKLSSPSRDTVTLQTSRKTSRLDSVRNVAPKGPKILAQLHNQTSMAFWTIDIPLLAMG